MADTAPTPNADPKMALLTGREQQVAMLLAVGWNHREISDELHIAIKTIDTHRQRILTKLNLRGNVDLARWAIRVGMVTNDFDFPRVVA